MNRQEAIAIVGIGGLFPASPDLPAFWRIIRDRIDATRANPAVVTAAAAARLSGKGRTSASALLAAWWVDTMAWAIALAFQRLNNDRLLELAMASEEVKKFRDCARR